VRLGGRTFRALGPRGPTAGATGPAVTGYATGLRGVHGLGGEDAVGYARWTQEVTHGNS
jgi:hypothetical protein